MDAAAERAWGRLTAQVKATGLLGIQSWVTVDGAADGLL